MTVWAIHHGDCIEVMRQLAAESVDAVITSPPYAMQRRSTYGGVPEADYPAWTVAWMSEVRRVLKPDGNAVINIRPHVKNGQISDYTLRTRLALRADGWAEVEELIWHKTDGPPMGSAARPRRAWESLHWFAKHGRSFSDPKAHGNAPIRKYRRTATSVATRNAWSHAKGVPPFDAAVVRVSDVVSMGKAKRSGFDHPAPYPPALAEWVAKLICPPGGTILDPFNGSGSTGVAAIRNGYSYVGIDAVEEYVQMSRNRLGGAA